MGRIQSTVGLASGLPIADTIDRLMEIASRPRDLLVERTAGLQQQQLAVTELTALTIGIQLAGERLGTESLFSAKTATSSQPEVLSAQITGTPPTGTFSYTPLRVAQSQQVLLGSFTSTDTLVGAGTLSIGQGGFVDNPIKLEELNDGTGVPAGSIRITDRSGNVALIDLQSARYLDDVLDAINNNTSAAVTAVAQGDSIQLVDQSGGSQNLQVSEVGNGTTAAALGLAGIDVSASQVTGNDILSLHRGLAVSQLNDGIGIGVRDALSDLDIQFRDGTSLQLDLGDPETLGDILDTLNAADPSRLFADISADGDRLELRDLSVDNGSTFTVTSSLGGSTAEDLGLEVASVGDLIAGRRVQGGLASALLSGFQGGQGLGTLGQITLTDRAGSSDTVDLSSAETLDNVVEALNNASVLLEASINPARNGIELRDVSGGVGNLIIANADATNTADALQIAVNAPQDEIDSGSLALQTVGRNTLLSDYNGGAGVDEGLFTITDSRGVTGNVNLDVLGAETVGDVLDAINGLATSVTARINDTGDGIFIEDTAGGAGDLLITDSGTGTSAADLRIAGQFAAGTVDGSTSASLTTTGTETLQEFVDQINELDAGVTASLLFDSSSSRPYRLLLASNTTGRDGSLLIDGLTLGLEPEEVVEGQDALLRIGGSTTSGPIVASSTNEFDGVLAGVTLSVAQASALPVNITIADDHDGVVAAVQLLVDQYNKLQDKLEEVTFFNAADNSTGILFGSGETLRIEDDLSRVLTSPVFNAGSIRSIEQLGLSLGEDGKLDFDVDELKDLLEEDADAVEAFLTTEDTGFADRLNAVVDTLSGEGDSLLLSRTESLQRRIDDNNLRIAFLEERLLAERLRLFNDFIAMERAIARVQNSLGAISAIQALPPLTASSASAN